MLMSQRISAELASSVLRLDLRSKLLMSLQWRSAAVVMASIASFAVTTSFLALSAAGSVASEAP
jgi:hypothetical protein